MANVRNMTEDKLYDFVEKCTIEIAGGTAQAQQEKQLQVGLAELQLRSQKALKESVDTFNASSEEYSQRIVFLTKVLVALTVVLLFVTLVVTVLAIPGALRAIFN